MTKSSKNNPRQILGVISAARAEEMLVEWVNTDMRRGVKRLMRGNAKAYERLFRRYPEILSVPLETIIPVDEKNLERFHRFHQQIEMADDAAESLRNAWDSPDLRRFEWHTWKAQLQYQWEDAQARHKVTASPMDRHLVKHKVEPLNEPLSSLEQESAFYVALFEAENPSAVITPIEAAIFHMRHSRNRALHCPNPDCATPYFFSSKKGQKYCSPECAKPSQRESKRKWWADNRAKGNI